MDGAPFTPAIQRRIPVGHLTLNVTEYGDGGEPVILLHGIGSRFTSWWPVVDQLAAHFRLLVPDLRGHGGSDKPDTGYLLPHYADDLEALLAAYQIDRPTIIGHSLGGMITLRWATRFPDRARKLVIEDSPLRKANDVEGLFDGWIRLVTLPVDEVVAYYAETFPGWSDEEYLRRAISITSTALPVFTELKAHNMKPDFSDRIAPFAVIQSPTLLVYGDTAAGGMVPAEDARTFAETLPNGKIAHIPDGTHSLHRDSPDRFLNAVLPFLRND